MTGRGVGNEENNQEMTKFKILRADSQNNETVDFDVRDTIESARDLPDEDTEDSADDKVETAEKTDEKPKKARRTRSRAKPKKDEDAAKADDTEKASDDNDATVESAEEKTAEKSQDST